jgi:DNA-binding response OmpR family regulator
MDNVGERVLLIEDDSRLADMVGEYLGKAGFFTSFMPRMGRAASRCMGEIRWTPSF